MASQKQKRTVLYGRLSQEDAREGESNSIANQRLLLEKYSRDNGFGDTVFLADDGYSGTNFDRPSWKKVVEMIEAGEVETLIVKDMSRLGREYLQVGYYTEIYLPQKGVRFIAVNDSVDSLVASSNDFNGIRNWFNEQHARDTSKKVRAVKKMQAERGERTGGVAPYGYKKRSADSKELVPNEETAPVVQHIFRLCAEGKGPGQIARILTEEQVLTPAHYSYQKYGISHAKLNMDYPYSWTHPTIENILRNPAYLGHTLSLQHTIISYKNKKMIARPESEQVLVKNTHEAIVSQELWDIVQDVRAHKKRAAKHLNEPNIFSGLLFCADCGKSLNLYRTRAMKKTSYGFKCYTYNKYGKSVCSAHHIRESELRTILLDDLRRVTHFARMKERQFAAYINKKNSAEFRCEMNTLQKELDSMRKRSTELSKLFKHLYEDYVLERVTAEQFRILSSDYNAEQKALEESIPKKEERLEMLRTSAANVGAFIEKAKRYTAIEELTPELVRLFIQRIEVGERSTRYSRNSGQSIRIVYRDIGSLDSAMEPGEQQPDIAPPLNDETICRFMAGNAAS